MDRVLEAPTPKPKRNSPREEFRLLFPGEKDWESWSLRPGKSPQLKSSIPQAELSAQTKAAMHLALPLQQLLIIPLWLATTDVSLMREMVSLQLESRGLGRSAVDHMFDYVVVRQENDRSLLSVSVLNENFPPDLCGPRVVSYRPATDYWTLPFNQLLVWRELGGVVLAFTSGADLIYVQSAPGETIHESLLYEAHCARLVLENEGSLPRLQGITVFGDFSRKDVDSLGQAMSLPIQQLERPVPARPQTQRKLIPSMVHSSQQEKSRARGKKKIMIACLGLYLAIAAAMIGQLAWFAWQRDVLDRGIASQRNEVATIRSASDRWQALELAILPETYPVEMLYRCTRLLPEEGVRFLTYDQDTNHILITGESKNAPAAFQYAEALKKSPELDAYLWEMPPPALLANDSAQFQIEGKRRDANPQIK